MTTQSLQEFLQGVRARSVPLVAIVSPDIPTMEKSIVEACGALQGVLGQTAPKGVMGWNSGRGVYALSENMRQGGRENADAIEPSIALAGILTLPAGVVVVMQNVDMWMEGGGKAEIVQGILNCRTPFNLTERTLILLGNSANLPGELAQDVVVYEEELPTQAHYQEMIEKLCQENGVAAQAEEVMRHSTEALRGLSLFAAEQTVSLNLKRSGIQVSELWAQKKRLVDQSRYLTFYYDLPGFEVMGGCEQVKADMRLALQSKRQPSAVLWLDEMGRMFASSETDSSGVSQRNMGYFLWWLEHVKAMAFLFLGVQGSSKSYTAQCVAGEGKIPLLRADMSACLESLVGSSEANLRHLVRMAEAIAGGGEKLLILATANEVEHLPGPLMRRFARGKYFFDIPNVEERRAIWEVQKRLTGIESPEQLVDDSGYSASDIAVCCQIADDYGMSLQEASTRIVAVERQDGEKIARMRQEAHGRYLSASYPGVYLQKKEEKGRTLELGV